MLVFDVQQLITTFMKKNMNFAFLVMACSFLTFALGPAALANCSSPESHPVGLKLDELKIIGSENKPAWTSTNSVLKIYEPSQLSSKMQVIVIPPTGGENFLDRHMAEKLCEAGLRTLILTYVSVYPTLTTDLKVHDLAAEEFLAQLELTLREQSRPTVLIGASLGGLFSSIAYGIATNHGLTNSYPLIFKPTAIVSQLNGAVLTVTGGPLSEILTDSLIPNAVLQRLDRLIADPMSLQQYQANLSKSIFLDTLKLTNPLYNTNILFFEGTLDIIVPTATQDQLWQAWGRPTRTSYFLGHPETIFYVYEFEVDSIRDFILSRFPH